LTRLLATLLALQIPVFFFFAASVFLLGRRVPDAWLPRLLALEFPVLAAGGVGLPLFALFCVLKG
jgi:hypothetical protein